jgi:hypothetical protein
MKYGKLHKTENIDPKFGSQLSYWRVLVQGPNEAFETLLLTESELERVRRRAQKSPEEELYPSWMDKLRAL